MIHVEGLSKIYGERAAVKSVSFDVKGGEIVGFLGPNGAGKTTTMRMLTGFIPPSEGTATIAGFDIRTHSMEARRRIGYLPEMPPVYREMVVVDYLRFVAELREVPAGERRRKIASAIERCGLESVSRRIIGRLSKGYRQRVGLAQAILHDPQVLILDEPTVGLDPKQIVEIRNVVRGFGGERTVILSTHILPEVTMTCDRVVIINQGQIVAEDTIDGLQERLERTERLSIRVARDAESAVRAAAAMPGVVGTALEPAAGWFTVDVPRQWPERERLAATIVSGGWGLLEIRPVTATLEEIFLKLITEERETAA